jgi:hypothetical protein
MNFSPAIIRKQGENEKRKMFFGGRSQIFAVNFQKSGFGTAGLV